jgi:hypothetical protein
VGEIEMSELATTFGPTRKPDGDASVRPPLTKSTESATLITEQQVRMSTAAAVALPPGKTRRISDLVEAVAAQVRVLFASSGKPPAQRHYPKRHVWLENSLMSREMDRL